MANLRLPAKLNALPAVGSSAVLGGWLTTQKSMEKKSKTEKAEYALELCEMWAKSDIEIYSGASFVKNLEHRLKIIREGLAELHGTNPPNAPHERRHD